MHTWRQFSSFRLCRDGQRQPDSRYVGDTLTRAEAWPRNIMTLSRQQGNQLASAHTARLRSQLMRTGVPASAGSGIPKIRFRLLPTRCRLDDVVGFQQIDRPPTATPFTTSVTQMWTTCPGSVRHSMRWVPISHRATWTFFSSQSHGTFPVTTS